MGNISAIIVAAGKGTRMGSNISKQFLNLKGKPILFYTLEAFQKSGIIDEIVLVTSEEHIEYCKKDIVEKYGLNKVTNIVAGGAERQGSVYNGLCALTNCDIVLIHDAARPFVDDKLIMEGVEYAKTYGACACGVRPKDTIKIKDEKNFSIETPDRSNLFAVQTPQCFEYNLIFNCHKKVIEDKIKVTDDTMVVEKYGNKVYLYEGSYNNIKITTPEDLIVAERILCS